MLQKSIRYYHRLLKLKLLVKSMLRKTVYDQRKLEVHATSPYMLYMLNLSSMKVLIVDLYIIPVYTVAINVFVCVMFIGQ